MEAFLEKLLADVLLGVGKPASTESFGFPANLGVIQPLAAHRVRKRLLPMLLNELFLLLIQGFQFVMEPAPNRMGVVLRFKVRGPVGLLEPVFLLFRQLLML